MALPVSYKWSAQKKKESVVKLFLMSMGGQNGALGDFSEMD